MPKKHLLAKLLILVLSVMFVWVIAGCGAKTNVENAASEGQEQNKVNGQNKASSKLKPDQLTKVNLALASKNISYLPIFVADKKELYKKYNLDVAVTQVQGGVLALRGLQTGDFQFISSLPESIITAVAEGANVKMIGTLDNQSMFSIYVAKDIKSPQDLKGKLAGGYNPGSGTDIQMRYWLQTNGLEPDKDVRVINAGGTSSRFQALNVGQVAVTILSQPVDLKADEVGFEKMALMRDVLQTYNHNILAANGDVLKNQPELASAFMAAQADAVDFIKDSANREEVVKIAMEALELSEAEVEKSIGFVLPSLADKGKLNVEGVQWAIDTVKEAGALNKDVSVDQIVDERFYAE